MSKEQRSLFANTSTDLLFRGKGCCRWVEGRPVPGVGMAGAEEQEAGRVEGVGHTPL